MRARREQVVFGRFGRRGTAIVEFAMVLPLLLLILLGIIEFAHIMFVRHNLINAATQGARVGIMMNSTEEMMAAAVQDALDGSGLSGMEIDIQTTIDDPPSMRVFSRTSVPYSEASIFGGFLPDDFELTSGCTMYR